MRRAHREMGEEWLKAGKKISALLHGKEPQFDEATLNWFKTCYQSASKVPSNQQQTTEKSESRAVTVNSNLDSSVSNCARRILDSLAVLARNPRDPEISVVVPVFGHFQYLTQCLSSIGSTRDVSLEIICINDASPDERIGRLCSLLSNRNSRLHIHQEAFNCGISKAQNRAVDLSQGQFVAFLDCDDYLAHQALDRVWNALRRYSNIDYLFTDRIDVDTKGNILRRAKYGGYADFSFSSQKQISADLMNGMVASHLKVIRKSVYRSVGGCDERWSGVQDWDLALKIAKNHQMHYLAEPLYCHRIHGASVTSTATVSQFRKTNELRRRHSINVDECRGVRKDEDAVTVNAIELPLSRTRLESLCDGSGRCVVDMRGTPNLGQLNFMREFNSYFDEVIWSDPEVPAALCGYEWRGLRFNRRL
jgi:hypothetical protein